MPSAYSTNDMTAHGFRAMASTLLNESGRWHPDAIAHGMVQAAMREAMSGLAALEDLARLLADAAGRWIVVDRT